MPTSFSFEDAVQEPKKFSFEEASAPPQKFSETPQDEEENTFYADRDARKKDLLAQMQKARGESLKSDLAAKLYGDAETAARLTPLRGTATRLLLNQEDPQPLPPIVSPEAIKSAAAENIRPLLLDAGVNPADLQAPAVKGAEEFGTELASGLTTPDSAALMLMGGPGARVFQAEMIKDSPNALQAAIDANRQKGPLSAEAVKADLGAALGVAGPLLIQKGLTPETGVPKLERTGKSLIMPEGAEPPTKGPPNVRVKNETPVEKVEPEVNEEATPVEPVAEVPAKEEVKILTPHLQVGEDFLPGKNHEEGMHAAISSGRDADAIEAMSDDSKHVFLDQNKKVYSRKAAQELIEEQHPGFKVSDPKMGLQSHDLPRLAEWLNKLDEKTPEVASDVPPEQSVPTVEPKPVTPVEAVKKVETEIQSVANTDGQRPAKEVKSELVSRIEKEIDSAPSVSDLDGNIQNSVRAADEIMAKRPPSSMRNESDRASWLRRQGDRAKEEMQSAKDSGLKQVTIEIPGDGSFTVWNTKEHLGELLSRAKRLDTSQTETGKIFSESKPSKQQGKLWAKEAQDEVDRQRVIESHQRSEELAASAERVAKNKENIDTGALGTSGMGGAKPGEFQGGQGSPTSIKNATVDRERAKRGLPPAMEPARRSFGEVWDRAMALLDQDPGDPITRKNIQDKLIDELREKPRALTDVEDALLLHRQLDLHEQYDRTNREMSQAYDDAKQFPNRMDAVVELRARSARLSDAILDLYNIGKKVGTETGRGLNARKMMAYEDYTLAKMTLDERAARGGRSLTEDETAEIQRLHDEIQRTQKAYDDYRAAQEERVRKLEADHALQKVALEAKAEGARIHPKIIEIAENIVKGLDTRADAARQRIRERMGRTSAGVDPTVLVDLAEIGASHLAHKIIDVAKWSEKMIQDVGDWVKPQLDDVFKASQKIIDDLANKTGRAEQVKKALKEQTPQEQSAGVVSKVKDLAGKNEKDKITWHIQKLAKILYQSGVTEREAMVDALHKLIEPVMPGVTRREVMDMFSGYGDYRQLNKEAITVAIRGMKGELQQIGKLEDIQSRKPPLKSGVERRTPTEEERRLLKQVNDAKRRYGITVTDPETQLQSALGARKTALRNQISDLEHEISTREKIVKTKAPSPTDAELEALKKQRDTLKAEHDNIFPKADRSDELALKALKTRLTNRIKDYEERLANKDFTARPKRTITLDPEATRLKAENERLKKQFQRGVALERLKNATRTERAGDWIVKWRRGFILSGPVTLAKLTSAALQRMTFTPIEEAIGAGIGKVIPKVSEKAPREGGFNVDAEAKAVSQALTQGLHDSWKVLRTGQSDLDVLYGKEALVPPSVVDFFGHVHGALKAPTKRAEFTRSLEKRSAHAIKNGVDVSDPLVQSRLIIDAYKDANRSIFQQDNRIVAGWNRMVNAWQQKDRNTGKTTLPGKALSTTARVLLPIVKIPTNIVAETLQYSTGLLTGSARLARAYRSGIDNLRPEEAELIMRELKKGSIGGAMLLLGFFNPDVIGGYYQHGEKRDKNDVKVGNIKLYGHNIPSFLLHNPLLETLQVGATIRRVADSKLRKSDKTTQGIPEGILAAGLGLAEEVPFVREMGEITKAFDPRQKGAFFGELGKSLLVPRGVQSLAEYTDKDVTGETAKRAPTTVLQHVETGIPGLRKDVPVKKGAPKPTP